MKETSGGERPFSALVAVGLWALRLQGMPALQAWEAAPVSPEAEVRRRVVSGLQYSFGMSQNFERVNELSDGP
jgi:hypothetical protein